MFQFHTGSIKREEGSDRREVCSGFNSILVRLKVCLSRTREIDVSWFQFHTGSIKSVEFTK